MEVVRAETPQDESVSLATLHPVAELTAAAPALSMEQARRLQEETRAQRSMRAEARRKMREVRNA